MTINKDANLLDVRDKQYNTLRVEYIGKQIDVVILSVFTSQNIRISWLESEFYSELFGRMLTENRLDFIINLIIFRPNWQYLPWCIDYIRSRLVEPKCVITSIEKNIVVVKKNSLKTYTFVADGFGIVSLLAIIYITNSCNILGIKIFTRMLKYQVVFG